MILSRHVIASFHIYFIFYLQVIVMSATMDVDLFSQYFNKSPVLYLEGRQHPIQIYYTKQPQSDYLHAALVSIFQIHQVSRILIWICLTLPINYINKFIRGAILCRYWLCPFLISSLVLKHVVFLPWWFSLIEHKDVNLFCYTLCNTHLMLVWILEWWIYLCLLWYLVSLMSIVGHAGGSSIPWHLGVYDRSGGDWSAGSYVSRHRQTPARNLWAHDCDRSVRITSSCPAAQGLSACT